MKKSVSNYILFTLLFFSSCILAADTITTPSGIRVELLEKMPSEAKVVRIGGGMTFSEISAAGLSSNTYPDDDHYIAEYLYQNPNVCYWDLQTFDGTKMVVPVDIPTPSSKAIQLPISSGGDDTDALEAIINQNPGADFVGSGNYRLNKLKITVPANIWSMQSQPFSNSTKTVVEIHSSDVKIFNSPIDGNGSTGLQFGYHIYDNSHRAHIVNSGMTNVRVTDGTSMSAIYINAADDFYIACSLFRNILNASGKPHIGRANGIWHVDSLSTSGGYIVNNTIENMQSNGVNSDAEFYTKQSFGSVGAPVRIFANRMIDGGKRLVKFQSDGGLVLSNRAIWTVKAGNPGMGNRKLENFIAVISLAGNITARNNSMVTEAGTLGQLDRIIAIGPSTSNSGVTDNVHIDNNSITINSDDNGAVNQNPSVFYIIAAGGGSYNRFTNSSIKNNVVGGNGGIEHYWDFTTWGLPSKGWPASNLDISGNVFSIPANVADYE